MSDRRRTPNAPSGLADAGKRLWRDLHSALDEDAEFDEREAKLLELACRQADDVAALQDAIDTDGLTIKGSTGQKRLHPAVSELRQARLALSRLLGELELPDYGEQPRTAASNRGQKAANKRWGRRQTQLRVAGGGS